MNSVHLMGSEEVGRAGHNIQAAAEQMSRAASTTDEACQQLRSSLDQHRYMLSCLMERMDEAPTLRDYFAVKALPGCLDAGWSDLDFRPVTGLSTIENIAVLAYQAADAMLKARSA